MSTYPFKCDLCGGVTELAPTYGDFKCQHCGQVYVYDECHRIELSERQLQTLRDSRWIAVSERLPELGERVMICNAPDRWVSIGSRQLTGTYHHWDGDNYEELNEPTHWMPLPDPPEVKPMNCDCTEAEQRMYSEAEDLENEITRLRMLIQNAAYLLQGSPVGSGCYEAWQILTEVK